MVSDGGSSLLSLGGEGGIFGVRNVALGVSGCMAVGLTCRPACVGKLQSGGQCQDLNHELFEVVWLCRTGCRYSAAWVQSWWCC